MKKKRYRLVMQVREVSEDGNFSVQHERVIGDWSNPYAPCQLEGKLFTLGIEASKKYDLHRLDVVK